MELPAHNCFHPPGGVVEVSSVTPANAFGCENNAETNAATKPTANAWLPFIVFIFKPSFICPYGVSREIRRSSQAPQQAQATQATTLNKASSAIRHEY